LTTHINSASDSTIKKISICFNVLVNVVIIIKQ
jgi:hypothetical protein